MTNNPDKIRMFADTHAIEVANFGINLGWSIDHADMRRFDENLDSLKRLFPAVNSPEVFQLTIGDAPQGRLRPPPPVSVRELTYFANDGQPVWKGSFGENRIIVSCCRYTRWEEIWPEAKERLDALLACIDSHNLVQSVVYSVTDSFNADQVEKLLIAPNLFKSNRFVPNQILESEDPRWDFNQGWFNDLNEIDQVLVRLECRSVIQNDLVMASISNLHSQQFETAIELGELLTNDGESSRVDQVFDDLHDKNKELLRNLLVDELLVRMRLKEDS